MTRVKPGVLVLAMIVVVAGLASAPVRASTQGGTELWTARYGAGNGEDSARSITASPDGSKVFVAGESFASTGYDYATIAYDVATGAGLWSRRYNGSGNGDDYAASVTASPDGSKVFVTGESGYDYATIAYDAATGDVLWSRRYDDPINGQDAATSVAASPDGSKVFVTGRSVGSIGYDYATFAYDAATGAGLWSRRYNGAGNYDDVAYSVSPSPDGSKVFVTGTSFGATGFWEYATIAYDAGTGASRWSRRYNGPGYGDNAAYSVAPSPDGSKVFVTGDSAGDYATIAYEAATGAGLWSRRYDGPGNGDDFARSAAPSPDGSKVFVTGWSFGSTGNYDYATFAYDAATGAGLWNRRFNGPGNYDDFAVSLAASPNGSKVFVTGYSFGSTGTSDYATIAYDAATGGASWIGRYNYPGDDYDVAYSVAASPDGSKVFVTGQSVGSTGNADYATVAYEA